jgi:diadenosine tetraphosphate (Ap4A) HIT family hydrolase
MKKPCPFCDRKKLEPRVFYEKDWCAFLAAPYHTKGHAILAARTLDKNCPTGLGQPILKSLGNDLARVADVLQKHYKPKDILVASVRGDIPHTHFHLIPLWPHEERKWRMQHVYEKGHLLEFLGMLERAGDSLAMNERIAFRWSEEEQRKDIVKRLRFDISALRKITGYS